jgi:hypothetical protein
MNLSLFAEVRSDVLTVASNQANDRDCQYLLSGSTSTPKKSEAMAKIKQEDGESRKRARRYTDSGWRNSTRAEDPLGSPVPY